MNHVRIVEYFGLKKINLRNSRTTVEPMDGCGWNILNQNNLPKYINKEDSRTLSMMPTQIEIKRRIDEYMWILYK
jgi:hypothetical protein